MLCVDCSIY